MIIEDEWSRKLSLPHKVRSAIRKTDTTDMVRSASGPAIGMLQLQRGHSDGH